MQRSDSTINVDSVPSERTQTANLTPGADDETPAPAADTQGDTAAETQGDTEADDDLDDEGDEGEDAGDTVAPANDQVIDYDYISPLTHPLVSLSLLSCVHPMQRHTRLLFTSHHVHALLMGTKVMTSRIGWAKRTIENHRGCMARRELVRCLVGYGNNATLGWVFYEKIWTQTVGDLTERQVVLEGAEGMSVREFQTKYLHLNVVRKNHPRVTLQTSMTCLQFVFIPMLGPGRDGEWWQQQR